MSSNSIQLPLLRASEAVENNPLTRRLPRFDTDEALSQAMEQDPFRGGVGNLDYKRRIPLVQEIRRVVSVTDAMLLAARGLHDALFASLDRQNPLDPANRRNIYESGSQVGKPILELPWRPEFAGGLVLSGWTGTGKTHTADRFLQLVPQVVLHEGKDAADCGCLILKQLVWLKVHMPSDGSRGGLVIGLLMELDRVLGTDYVHLYHGNSWSIEKQLVAIIHILVAHRCGLVVIDEAQEATLARSRFGKEFVVFFLRLLNAGMAVALMGNPLAFTQLMSLAQSQARLTEFGWFDFTSPVSASDLTWTDDLVPGIWKQSKLLAEPDEPMKDLEKFLFGLTGGNPRYLARLRAATLLLGLRTGAVRVTKELVEEASRSPAMAGVRDQVDAFAQHDLSALSRWTDIPGYQVRAVWIGGEPAKDSREFEAPADPEPQEKVASKKSSKSATAPQPLQVVPAKPEDYRSKEFEAKLLAELGRIAGGKT